MLQEFKDFVNKGNVVDLAVAVVLGAAFAPVIAAIVSRVLMPLIGVAFGSPNFDTVGLFACGAEGEGLIDGCAGSVGAVVTALINFLLVGLALFLVVRVHNRMNATDEPEVESESEPDPPDVVLLREIRDALTDR